MRVNIYCTFASTKKTSMSFKSLGLISQLLEAVDKQGYTIPSAIQEKSIPIILERKDHPSS